MVFYFVEGRLNTTYNVFPPEINVPTNQADLDLGQHLVEALAGCQDCHSMDLEGMVIADNLLEGRIVATNLTSGKGGVGSDYSNADWVRANDPLFEFGFRYMGGSAQQERIWQHVLTALATHYGLVGQVKVQKTLVDPKLQWSEAKNLWHNSVIRTTLYSPIRLIKKLFR
jgi:hypothetical protein